MRGTSPLFAFVLVVLLGGALAGCASRKTSMYDHEDFDESSTYSRSYAAPAVKACESARRALLSQGYLINKASTDVVDGRKSFQQTAEAHVEIEFHIVCAPDSADGTSSSVFVNAVQDRYTLKKTASSASLGVSILGSVSMPFGTSDDSMVKVGSETIAAPRFYNGFFGLLEQYLAPMQGRAAAQAAEAAAAASAAAARAQAPVPQPAGAIPASATPGVQTAAPKAAAPQATDARPVELKPVEPAAAAAKAAEFKAAESKAAESTAAESKAAESKAVESKAVESKAAEPKAAESKAAEPKAAESKAVESKAAESKSDVPASAPGSSPDALPSAPASTPASIPAAPAAQPSAPVADPVAPGAAPGPDVPTAN
ncbi:DUF2242 domain-containing protein [Pigmentiphaga litoralis]|uniref:Chemotaxis protein histidine kinase CheA n=1 Tax=Pigmentiphaga litoralis TaxID=516702 RepID=A0A7Y9IYB9_9BURK|nr:DUF2242 domain-containing protein [Pigmentiphaga litoralis]NYE21961.1 chemotaxis protein histidine kinase CheA [Pigmentiphaga litoralis]NYE84424.1 chemotaxis protein histidine kinase CheA [Pigmentiphaga litoralis]